MNDSDYKIVQSQDAENLRISLMASPQSWSLAKVATDAAPPAQETFWRLFEQERATFVDSVDSCWLSTLRIGKEGQVESWVSVSIARDLEFREALMPK